MSLFMRLRKGHRATDAPASTDLNGHLSSSPDAKTLRQMDATIRCIVSLGRPSGCGMPGSVAAAPLAQLLQAAAAHMQQCVQLHQNGSLAARRNQGHAAGWSFVDIGAGSGRMLLAAHMFGATCCVGLELCDLRHTFEGCRARLLKKGLLQPSAVSNCKLYIGDAMQYRSSTELLGKAAAAAAGPVMVSLIDEGMPLSVREHVYGRVAADARVCVVVTVNFRSREGHLPAVLTQAGFKLVREMPAPLMGGKCSTAGRIYVRQRQMRPQQTPVAVCS